MLDWYSYSSWNSGNFICNNILWLLCLFCLTILWIKVWTNKSKFKNEWKTINDVIYIWINLNRYSKIDWWKKQLILLDYFSFRWKFNNFLEISHRITLQSKNDIKILVYFCYFKCLGNIITLLFYVFRKGNF